jgi:hypothetical protein
LEFVISIFSIKVEVNGVSTREDDNSHPKLDNIDND